MCNFDELEDSLGKVLDMFGRYLEEQQSNALSVEDAVEAFCRCANECAKGDLYGTSDMYPSDSVDITDLI